ncbi:hypothetical protein Tco_0235248, partial [Tanacetum coccineum]
MGVTLCFGSMFGAKMEFVSWIAFLAYLLLNQIKIASFVRDELILMVFGGVFGTGEFLLVVDLWMMFLALLLLLVICPYARMAVTNGNGLLMLLVFL